MLQGLLRSSGFSRLVAKVVHALNIKALQFRNTLVIFSWPLVQEALHRDNDFRIGPINGERMRRVSGPFILGLDRGPESFGQRDTCSHAMCGFDIRAIARDIEADAASVAAEAPTMFDVVNGYARPIATRTAIRLFGVSGPSESALMELTRTVFHQTFLNLNDRDPAVKTAGEAGGRQLSRWILDEIEDRRASGRMPHDMLSGLMRNPNGGSDKDMAVLLSGYLVGAIDTTTTAFAYIVSELLKDKSRLKGAMRDIDDLDRLNGWCLEALRHRPQAPILMRQTAGEMSFAGKSLPAETTIIAATAMANFDPEAFPDPDRLDPSRPRDHYLHFGSGSHICGGRDVNAVQFPILLRHLLRRVPQSAQKIAFAGPFPDRLMVTLGDPL